LEHFASCRFLLNQRPWLKMASRKIQAEQKQAIFSVILIIAASD